MQIYDFIPIIVMSHLQTLSLPHTHLVLNVITSINLLLKHTEMIMNRTLVYLILINKYMECFSTSINK